MELIRMKYLELTERKLELTGRKVGADWEKIRADWEKRQIGEHCLCRAWEL